MALLLLGLSGCDLTFFLWTSVKVLHTDILFLLLPAFRPLMLRHRSCVATRLSFSVFEVQCCTTVVCWALKLPCTFWICRGFFCQAWIIDGWHFILSEYFWLLVQQRFSFCFKRWNLFLEISWELGFFFFSISFFRGRYSALSSWQVPPPFLFYKGAGVLLHYNTCSSS